MPCCSQCIHSECLLQCLVSARLSQLQTPSSSAEATRDLCPACKQPTVLPPAVAAAVDSAAAAAAKDAAAAERAEMAARAYRDAKEREIAKTQRRKALLDKFTSAPNCSVCVLAHPTQTTKYFMHAFGTTFLPSHHDVAPHLTAAKFCPLECAHAYKNDSHLGARNIRIFTLCIASIHAFRRLRTAHFSGYGIGGKGCEELSRFPHCNV